jgi:exopolysaccharide biosynthesis polyprenyl glycosylphosphotransferase
MARLLAVGDLLAGVTASAVLAILEGFTVAASWILLAPAWISLTKLFGLYGRDRQALRHLTTDELRSLFLWALTGTGVLTLFLQGASAGRIESPNAALAFAVIFGSALLLRGGARLLWRAITPAERTIILGTGRLAEAARRKLELFPDMHIELHDGCADFTWDALKALDGQLGGVDRVIVASQALDEALLARLVTACKEKHTRLSIIPPERGMFGPAVLLSHIADLPVIECNTQTAGRGTVILKRTIDIAVSSVGLIVLAPILVAIGLAVRISSPGPAVFAQIRAGQYGRPFRMFKFRTMAADAESRLGDVVSIEDLSEPVFKVHSDPRVTRFGRMLRRTSLDELPQLINVLIGDMSLVGPRPEQIDLVARYTPSQRLRLDVKPGLTGPMQVYGRGELTLEERLAVERDYIENLSVSRDMKILAMTIPTVLSGRGAL